MTEQSKKTILVVDDVPENIDLLLNALNGEYKVLAALNGEGAVKILQGDLVPDLVMTDIMMPGMSGYEVCEYIRSNTDTQNIPVIFVSGTITEEVRATGIGAGGNDFISKPFSVQGIREKLKTILSHE